jgi:hypothetical protein
VKFFAVLVLGTFLSVVAHAEPKTCQQVYNLGMEMGCSFSKADQSDPSNSSTSSTLKEDDYTVRSTFGPTACKTQDLARELVRDLKTECNSWLKERKADLGSKYQTGTCGEECTDCTMGLKRCSVNGVAHYAK